MSVAMLVPPHDGVRRQQHRPRDGAGGNRLDTSTASIPSRPATTDDDEDDVRHRYDTMDVSIKSASRDASGTHRDMDLDNTRQTVNTRDSILDFSRDDEDDEGDDANLEEWEDWTKNNSILFDDLHQQPPHQFAPSSPLSSPARAAPAPVSPTASTRKAAGTAKKAATKKVGAASASTMLGGISLYSVTHSFVDSLCTSAACVAADAGTDRLGSAALLGCDTYYSWQGGSSSGGGGSSPSRGCKQRDAARDRHNAPAAGGCGGGDPTDAVHVDVWQLLGCSASPGEAELEEIWSLRTAEMVASEGGGGRRRPVRASIRRRLKRIHALRGTQEGHSVGGASRHGVTLTSAAAFGDGTDRKSQHHNRHRPTTTGRTQPYPLDKAYSMLDDPLADFIGRGIEPIHPIEDGYDSDPELNCSMNRESMLAVRPSAPLLASSDNSEETERYDATEPPSPSVRAVGASSPPPASPALGFSETEHSDMRRSIQETLNSTWTLTWHPNPENMRDYHLSNKPICVNVWLERGTVIAQSGVVVEPSFMWRDAYQPLLPHRRTLNASTQKPWSMRMLNACRIAPCGGGSGGSPASSLDRTRYPLARLSSSFVVKASDGQEFLLEARSHDEVLAVTDRWKMAVARFASLAVTEDVERIAKEFFHPTLDSHILTVPDDF